MRTRKDKEIKKVEKKRKMTGKEGKKRKEEKKTIKEEKLRKEEKKAR